MQTIRTIDSQFYRKVGEYLRRIRKFRNMTLEELSEKTGYSRPLLDHWELGLNKIKPKQFENVCKALNVSPSMDIKVKIGYLLDD